MFYFRYHCRYVFLDWNNHDVGIEVHTAASFEHEEFQKSWIPIFLKKNCLSVFSDLSKNPMVPQLEDCISTLTLGLYKNYAYSRKAQFCNGCIAAASVALQYLKQSLMQDLFITKTW